MTPEIKKQWIEALRSGKYEQGQRYLERDDGSLCCLGVLCKIVDIPTKDHRGGGVSFPESTKLGLKKIHFKHGVMRDLASMNDDRGKSFIEIANWIEENVETTETFNE